MSDDYVPLTTYPPYPPAAGTPALTPQPPPEPPQLWPVDAKRFRTDLPEFADPVTYTVTTINYWLTVSQLLNNPCAWGTLLPTGIEMLAAHFITEEAQALKVATASGGALPGIAGASGPISSKAVDRVNVAYAVQAALETGPAGSGGAGSYNGTIYGRRWWHFSQLVGAGAIQL